MPSTPTQSPSMAAGDTAVDWYDAAPVLAYRRALIQDILRALNATEAQIAHIDQLRGESLRKLAYQVTQQTIIAGYTQFWTLQDLLGLPDPFAFLPVHPALDRGIETLRINGFGPSMYAFENWPFAYADTRGLHTGIDYLVPAGSPLIAVADGLIVDFPFLPDPAERTLALRPFLPPGIRRRDGTRALSNVIVGYGHLTLDTPAGVASNTAGIGEIVGAGAVIGASGWPGYTQDDGDVIIQHHNAHLHIEMHLVRDGDFYFGADQPFNPLLFFAPPLVAFQARLAKHSDGPPYPQGGQPFGKLGFFELGCFRLEPPTIAWDHEPSRSALWPEGVYDLDAMLAYVAAFEAYMDD